MANAMKIFFHSFLDGFTNIGPFSPSDQDWAPVGVFAPEPGVSDNRATSVPETDETARIAFVTLSRSSFIKVMDKSGRLVEVEVDRDGRVAASAIAAAQLAEASREWH